MPFGLKNAGATYQRLVNKIFKEQIGKTMEVYVDDMLVKAPKRADHIGNLAESFSLICQYRMKLNPTLKKGQRDKWDEECKVAFQNLKTYLTSPPLLSKTVPGEDLFVFLAVSNSAISSALIREELGAQHPVFYTSKALIDGETRYPKLEKLILALRLMKWVVELSKYDLLYRPKTAIKAQALADFVVEFTPSVEKEKLVNQKKESSKADGTSAEPSQPRDIWQLRVDGASNQKGAGAGVVITTPDGTLLEQAITLGFPASNNEAEYEALLAGLRLAKELTIKKLAIYSDSQLITNQASVPRAENAHADALASLGSALDTQFRRSIPVEHLDRPSIEEIELIDTMQIDEDPSWQDPVIDYLTNENLPTDKSEATKVQQKAARYYMHGNKLICRSYSGPHLTCIRYPQTLEVLCKIHDGECGNHSGGQSLVTDNGSQFIGKQITAFFAKYKIKQHLSTLRYPQGNGQAEASNKVILDCLKKRLEGAEGKWVNELPGILWAYCTTKRRSTGETPFSLAYETEAIIPPHITVPSISLEVGNVDQNSEQMRLNLDLLEGEREKTIIRVASYQQQLKSYHDKRAKVRQFQPGDLVLRKAFITAPRQGSKKMNPNWEGPYMISRSGGRRSYTLDTMEEKEIPRQWNAHHLRKYYP
ncbi:uncharacterized protein LOC109948104 [Prunus persica]|uniref:uncharacterized protein LOC109948104 n=1 Tax=Prunus persica TaxID=3760 RepID=UPI0009AB71BF|nr:uncharacterized protein LOC109948104 [Prunus persica]